ncbi:MAG: DNA polymerase III subunit chi [Reyranellaceae bacterium]
MTEVGFYHLTRSTLEQTLPRLLEKALQGGARCLVMAGSPERVEALNAHLWTYDPNSFLPHGSARDGNAAKQPVWLTDMDENPPANAATMLFLTDGARSDNVGKYVRCFELFDGRDESAVAKARERWKQYRDAGHSVAYWQQNERGGWEKKAG